MTQSVTLSKTPFVVRSSVPIKPSYSDYKQELRIDFHFSCAYCNMAESEATAIRFTIDHYEPQGARPDLRNTYDNLMYACDSCNQRKGNRVVPEAARADGLRFYRPDIDVFSDHFTLKEVRLSHTTKVGDFTIEALDLNRLELRRLREIRKRLHDCNNFISQGVQALRKFKVDQLPASVKGKADIAIKRALAEISKTEVSIDHILSKYAESPLSGEEPEDQARLKERKRKLEEIQTLYPGSWRAPRT